MKRPTLGFLFAALLGVSATDAAAPIVPSGGAWPGFFGLTHYWKLDEASGVKGGPGGRR